MRRRLLCMAMLMSFLVASCTTAELQQLDYTCEGLYFEETEKFEIPEIPFGGDFEETISESVSYKAREEAAEGAVWQLYDVANPATFMGKPVKISFTVSTETDNVGVVALQYYGESEEELMDFYNTVIDEMLELYGLPRFWSAESVEREYRDGSTWGWYAWENFGLAPSDKPTPPMDEIGNQTEVTVEVSDDPASERCVVVRVVA